MRCRKLRKDCGSKSTSVPSKRNIQLKKKMGEAFLNRADLCEIHAMKSIWLPCLSKKNPLRYFRQMTSQISSCVGRVTIVKRNQTLSESSAQRELYRKENRCERKSYRVKDYQTTIVPQGQKQGIHHDSQKVDDVSTRDVKTNKFTQHYEVPKNSEQNEFQQCPKCLIEKPETIRSSVKIETMPSKSIFTFYKRKPYLGQGFKKSEGEMDGKNNVERNIIKTPTWFLDLCACSIRVGLNPICPMDLLNNLKEVKKFANAPRSLYIEAFRGEKGLDDFTFGTHFIVTEILLFSDEVELGPLYNSCRSRQSQGRRKRSSKNQRDIKHAAKDQSQEIIPKMSNLGIIGSSESSRCDDDCPSNRKDFHRKIFSGVCKSMIETGKSHREGKNSPKTGADILCPLETINSENSSPVLVKSETTGNHTEQTDSGSIFSIAWRPKQLLRTFPEIHDSSRYGNRPLDSTQYNGVFPTEDAEENDRMTSDCRENGAQHTRDHLPPETMPRVKNIYRKLRYLISPVKLSKQSDEKYDGVDHRTTPPFYTRSSSHVIVPSNTSTCLSSQSLTSTFSSPVASVLQDLSLNQCGPYKNVNNSSLCYQKTYSNNNNMILSGDNAGEFNSRKTCHVKSQQTLQEGMSELDLHGEISEVERSPYCKGKNYLKWICFTRLRIYSDMRHELHNFVRQHWRMSDQVEDTNNGKISILNGPKDRDTPEDCRIYLSPGAREGETKVNNIRCDFVSNEKNCGRKNNFLDGDNEVYFVRNCMTEDKSHSLRVQSHRHDGSIHPPSKPKLSRCSKKLVPGNISLNVCKSKPFHKDRLLECSKFSQVSFLIDKQPGAIDRDLAKSSNFCYKPFCHHEERLNANSDYEADFNASSKPGTNRKLGKASTWGTSNRSLVLKPSRRDVLNIRNKSPLARKGLQKRVYMNACSVFSKGASSSFEYPIMRGSHLHRAPASVSNSSRKRVSGSTNAVGVTRGHPQNVSTFSRYQSGYDSTRPRSSGVTVEFKKNEEVIPNGLGGRFTESHETEPLNEDYNLYNLSQQSIKASSKNESIDALRVSESQDSILSAQDNEGELRGGEEGFVPVPLNRSIPLASSYIPDDVDLGLQRRSPYQDVTPYISPIGERSENNSPTSPLGSFRELKHKDSLPLAAKRLYDEVEYSKITRRRRPSYTSSRWCENDMRWPNMSPKRQTEFAPRSNCYRQPSCRKILSEPMTSRCVSPSCSPGCVPARHYTSSRSKKCTFPPNDECYVRKSLTQKSKSLNACEEKSRSSKSRDNLESSNLFPSTESLMKFQLQVLSYINQILTAGLSQAGRNCDCGNKASASAASKVASSPPHSPTRKNSHCLNHFYPGQCRDSDTLSDLARYRRSCMVSSMPTAWRGDYTRPTSNYQKNFLSTNRGSGSLIKKETANKEIRSEMGAIQEKVYPESLPQYYKNKGDKDSEVSDLTWGHSVSHSGKADKAAVHEGVDTNGPCTSCQRDKQINKVSTFYKSSNPTQTTFSSFRCDKREGVNKKCQVGRSKVVYPSQTKKITVTPYNQKTCDAQTGEALMGDKRDRRSITREDKRVPLTKTGIIEVCADANEKETGEKAKKGQSSSESSTICQQLTEKIRFGKRCGKTGVETLCTNVRPAEQGSCSTSTLEITDLESVENAETKNMNTSEKISGGEEKNTPETEHTRSPIIHIRYRTQKIVDSQTAKQTCKHEQLQPQCIDTKVKEKMTQVIKRCLELQNEIAQLQESKKMDNNNRPSQENEGMSGNSKSKELGSVTDSRNDIKSQKDPACEKNVEYNGNLFEKAALGSNGNIIVTITKEGSLDKTPSLGVKSPNEPTPEENVKTDTKISNVPTTEDDTNVKILMRTRLDKNTNTNAKIPKDTTSDKSTKTNLHVSKKPSFEISIKTKGESSIYMPYVPIQCPGFDQEPHNGISQIAVYPSSVYNRSHNMRCPIGESRDSVKCHPFNCDRPSLNFSRRFEDKTQINVMTNPQEDKRYVSNCFARRFKSNECFIQNEILFHKHGTTTSMQEEFDKALKTESITDDEKEKLSTAIQQHTNNDTKFKNDKIFTFNKTVLKKGIEKVDEYCLDVSQNHTDAKVVKIGFKPPVIIKAQNSEKLNPEMSCQTIESNYWHSNWDMNGVGSAQTYLTLSDRRPNPRRGNEVWETLLTKDTNLHSSHSIGPEISKPTKKQRQTSMINPFDSRKLPDYPDTEKYQKRSKSLTTSRKLHQGNTNRSTQASFQGKKPWSVIGAWSEKAPSLDTCTLDHTSEMRLHQTYIARGAEQGNVKQTDSKSSTHGIEEIPLDTESMSEMALTMNRSRCSKKNTALKRISKESLTKNMDRCLENGKHLDYRRPSRKNIQNTVFSLKKLPDNFCSTKSIIIFSPVESNAPVTKTQSIHSHDLTIARESSNKSRSLRQSSQTLPSHSTKFARKDGNGGNRLVNMIIPSWNGTNINGESFHDNKAARPTHVRGSVVDVKQGRVGDLSRSKTVDFTGQTSVREEQEGEGHYKIRKGHKHFQSLGDRIFSSSDSYEISQKRMGYTIKASPKAEPLHSIPSNLNRHGSVPLIGIGRVVKANHNKVVLEGAFITRPSFDYPVHVLASESSSKSDVLKFHLIIYKEDSSCPCAIEKQNISGTYKRQICLKSGKFLSWSFSL